MIHTQNLCCNIFECTWWRTDNNQWSNSHRKAAWYCFVYVKLSAIHESDMWFQRFDKQRLIIKDGCISLYSYKSIHSTACDFSASLCICRCFTISLTCWITFIAYVNTTLQPKHFMFFSSSYVTANRNVFFKSSACCTDWAMSPHTWDCGVYVVYWCSKWNVGS